MRVLLDENVTLDSNMQYQQHVGSLDIAIIVIAGRSTRLEDIEPAMTEINKNIREVRAGAVVRLEV